MNNQEMNKQEILTVMEKYKVYFEMWDADVAIGITGDKIFYVLNENNEIELFTKFQTADELERIILGTLAENITVMMTSITDELNLQFTKASMDAVKTPSEVTEYLPLLAKDFAIIRKTVKEWSHMIEMTFKPLKDLGFQLEED